MSLGWLIAAGATLRRRRLPAASEASSSASSSEESSEVSRGVVLEVVRTQAIAVQASATWGGAVVVVNPVGARQKTRRLQIGDNESNNQERELAAL